MNQDKYVFAQLVEFLNKNKFRKLVDKYDGNHYVKHFTCWNQLLAMMFGQLSNRESLRDLIVALQAHQRKRYHLGLGRDPIAKTTLATANQNRDYRIFEDFAFYIMKEASEKRFWGTTENAVRIQISVAIITYCLVAIVQHDMKLNRSTYEVLQILSISLTDKTHLSILFDKTNFNDVKEQLDPLIPGLYI